MNHTDPRDEAILLAEDDPCNQVVAAMMLRRLGFANITIAANGDEAQRACDECDFALILMDCEMPVMDGFAATRAIRRRGIRTPIIAFTASEAPGLLARCTEAGMDDLLPKPVSLGLMREKVWHWLAKADSRRRHICFDVRALIGRALHAEPMGARRRPTGGR